MKKKENEVETEKQREEETNKQKKLLSTFFLDNNHETYP